MQIKLQQHQKSYREYLCTGVQGPESCALPLIPGLCVCIVPLSFLSFNISLMVHQAGKLIHINSANSLKHGSSMHLLAVPAYPFAGYSWHWVQGRQSASGLTHKRQKTIHTHIRTCGQFKSSSLTQPACLWTVGGSPCKLHTERPQPRTLLLWGLTQFSLTEYNNTAMP